MLWFHCVPAGSKRPVVGRASGSYVYRRVLCAALYAVSLYGDHAGAIPGCLELFWQRKLFLQHAMGGGGGDLC